VLCATYIQDEILEVISTSRQAGLMVMQHICKYFVERAHYMVKVGRLVAWQV